MANYINGIEWNAASFKLHSSSKHSLRYEETLTESNYKTNSVGICVLRHTIEFILELLFFRAIELMWIVYFWKCNFFVMSFGIKCAWNMNVAEQQLSKGITFNCSYFLENIIGLENETIQNFVIIEISASLQNF